MHIAARLAGGPPWRPFALWPACCESHHGAPWTARAARCHTSPSLLRGHRSEFSPLAMAEHDVGIGRGP
eukprot:8992650-Pyramimonas_sp.AAC.1